MNIGSLMTRHVEIVSPRHTLAEVAERMRHRDIGSVLVSEDDRIVGVLTDRDIVVRALAQGDWGGAEAGQYMSRSIKYCFADEDLEHVAGNMAALGVRRLPVLDRDKRLVGIVSLANVVQSDPAGAAASTLADGVTCPRPQ